MRAKDAECMEVKMSGQGLSEDKSRVEEEAILVLESPELWVPLGCVCT